MSASPPIPEVLTMSSFYRPYLYKIILFFYRPSIFITAGFGLVKFNVGVKVFFKTFDFDLSFDRSN